MRVCRSAKGCRRRGGGSGGRGLGRGRKRGRGRGRSFRRRASCFGAPHQDLAVDHGSRAARWSTSAASSGKRSVTRSSPRDHRNTSPPRATSWPRMPSYFHSTCQSSKAARAARRSARPVRSMHVRGRTDTAARATPRNISPGRSCRRRSGDGGAISVSIGRGARPRSSVGVAHQPMRDDLRVDARHRRRAPA